MTGRELHRVEWFISNAAEPSARFTCTAPIGATCRCWCTEGCDEFCSGKPVYGDPELVAQAPVDGHRWADTGECRIVTWLENGGTPGELFMGEDDEPLRSGWIETEWEGDCYLWQYAEAAQ